MYADNIMLWFFVYWLAARLDGWMPHDKTFNKSRRPCRLDPLVKLTQFLYIVPSGGASSETLCEQEEIYIRSQNKKN